MFGIVIDPLVITITILYLLNLHCNLSLFGSNLARYDKTRILKIFCNYFLIRHICNYKDEKTTTHNSLYNKQYNKE